MQVDRSHKRHKIARNMKNSARSREKIPPIPHTFRRYPFWIQSDVIEHLKPLAMPRGGTGTPGSKIYRIRGKATCYGFQKQNSKKTKIFFVPRWCTCKVFSFWVWQNAMLRFPKIFFQIHQFYHASTSTTYMKMMISHLEARVDIFFLYL